LSFFLVPIPKLQHAPLPQSATSEGACPNSLFFCCFHLRLTFESIKEVGSASRANFPQACAWPKSKAPSQNDTHGLTHAYSESQTWVRNTPSHIAASYHLSHHEVTEFASWDVVIILWNEFQLNAFLKKFPCVAMGLPFFVPHCLPPCGSIAVQIGLGKFHSWVSPNFSNMKIILHFHKPNIYHLLILDPVKIPRLNSLKSYTFRWSSFEGHNQVSEIWPIHFK
jgi:hypothetical protein